MPAENLEEYNIPENVLTIREKALTIASLVQDMEQTPLILYFLLHGQFPSPSSSSSSSSSSSPSSEETKPLPIFSTTSVKYDPEQTLKFISLIPPLPTAEITPLPTADG